MNWPSEEDEEPVECAICGRSGLALTKHHLIPRTTHKRKRIRKRYTSEQLAETAWTCRACHSQIHATFGEMELADTYNTIEALINHPEMQRYAAWASRQRGRIQVRGKRD